MGTNEGPLRHDFSTWLSSVASTLRRICRHYTLTIPTFPPVHHSFDKGLGSYHLRHQMVDAIRAAAASAICAIAGFKQLRAAFDACRPLRESESEPERAGRLGELEVALLFQGVSGVLVYQSLRIPDRERGGRREIDLVVLTRKKLYVIEVKNWAGAVHIQPDGRWCQVRRNGSRHTLPDVLEDTSYRAALLEEYIARRGVNLPPDFVEYRVFLINPQCRPVDEIAYQPEIVTSEKWRAFLDEELQQESWLKNLLPGLRKDAMHEQLKYILSSAPTWDKLYLEGGRIVVGDFVSFSGGVDDMRALQPVKRSSTSYIEMQHVRSLFRNLLGLLLGVCPEVKLRCTSRDLRESFFLRRKYAPEITEVRVQPDLEIVFRVVGSSKPYSFLVNNICSLSLSV